MSIEKCETLVRTLNDGEICEYNANNIMIIKRNNKKLIAEPRSGNLNPHTSNHDKDDDISSNLNLLMQLK